MAGGWPARSPAGPAVSERLDRSARLVGASGAGLTPAGWADHVVPMVRCRPIGLRLTSAAAQLACSRALSLPMYRLLRAP
jgi:hypothetical protein